MNKFIVSMVLVISMCVAIPSFANPEKSGIVPEKEHLEMLYPTVLVRLGNGSGSGTVIYSLES